MFAPIPPSGTLASLRHTPLAGAFAALFAFAAPAAHAALVTNCFDSGPGSLRDTVAAAASGDTIDLSGLSCVASSLTLSTGAIAVPQASLTLLGPGAGALRIVAGGDNASHDDGVFDHQGSGTLTLQDLTLLGGRGHFSSAYNAVLGGCVYSRGNVLLTGTTVAACRAAAFSGGPNPYVAAGGGIFTVGNLTAIRSAIAENYAGVGAGGQLESHGGGAYVEGNFVAKYSTISNNSAGSGTALGKGGGLQTFGNVTLSNSTLSGNAASYAAGGLSALGFGGQLTITNSTISGNIAPKQGGLYSVLSSKIYNSTIAFNRKTALTGNAAGATFAAVAHPITVGLYSSLIANNTYVKSGAVANNDIAVAPAANTVTFTGVDDLIRAPDPSVPMSSFLSSSSGVCPLLGPLRDNGGPTPTHALFSGSPAIDMGGGTSSDDQRGSGYARNSGGGVDIGAYEVQQADIVFSGGFEGCP